MSDRAKYSRVYWRILEDEEFDGIRENEGRVGAWVLMLLAAEMSWPTPAYIPPVVTRKSVEALATAGLIEPLTGGRFRLRGLDKERERRKSAATRDPDGTQLGPRRDPSGRVAETSRAETSKDKDGDEQDAGARDDKDHAVAYWELTGRFPTDKTLGWLDDLALRFGSEAVVRALATSHIANPSVKDLLGRTQDRLRAEARELDRKERAAEQARLQEKRAKPPALEEWREEYRRHLEQEYGDAA